jgi:hypothetical protein
VVATQDDKTVFKHSLDKKQLQSGDILEGLRINLANVAVSQMITIRFMVEEDNI